MDTIEDHIVHLPDWRRQTTVKFNGRVIRATVERDFYAFQNRIYSEVWSDQTASWNRVQTLAGAEYKDLPGAGSKDHDAIFQQTADVVDSMIDYAKAVLA